MKGAKTMLNWSLLENLLIIAIACSSVTVILIQKTKKFCKNSDGIILYSIFINLLLGFFFCQTFTKIDYIQSLWVGLFSFLGADTIFKNLEGKLSSYSDLVGKVESSIPNALEVVEEKDTTTEEKEDNIVGEITYE